MAYWQSVAEQIHSRTADGDMIVVGAIPVSRCVAISADVVLHDHLEPRCPRQRQARHVAMASQQAGRQV